MADAIVVSGLTKTFKAKQKEAGLLGSLKCIMKPNYKTVNAVDHISFNVKRGELVGFIGPNGAGKSTTIKMMSGILFPDAGDVSILGFDPRKKRKKLAYHIGTVFGQKSQLWYHLPAIDTFNLFSKIYELDEKKYRRRLRELVKLFEVEGIINQPVRKLSLGQRMRCEMIASLLHSPKLLFLDEPTIGLDLVVKKKIRGLIKRLSEKEGLTVILTSHDMEDVEQICGRLIIINEGGIVYDGTTSAIREKYLKYKVVKVVLDQKTSSLGLPKQGIKILERRGFKHTVEVDTTKVSVGKTVHKIFANHFVEDITILDPPIEEIIERIFKKEV